MLNIECRVCRCNAVQDTKSFLVLWWELHGTIHDPCIVCNAACVAEAIAAHKKSHSGACTVKTRPSGSVINRKAVGTFEQSFGRGWTDEARQALLKILQVTIDIPQHSPLAIVSTDTPLPLTMASDSVQSVLPGLIQINGVGQRIQSQDRPLLDGGGDQASSQLEGRVQERDQG